MTTTNKKTRYSAIKPSERLPEWIKPSLGTASQLEKVQNLVKEYRLNTICEEGRCPNRGECYASGTATFLLGGSICTRSCAFCQVEKGMPPQNIDPNESIRVAKAVLKLQLKYVVLTSVARDDLDDHGAIHFSRTIHAIRKTSPTTSIEVLTPDFWGGCIDKIKATKIQRERLKIVLKAKPVCFNHNLETVERLQKEVRRGATYHRSLELLKASREIDNEIPTKSGLMLGLGERSDEIIQTLKDLRSVNCQQVTIGQYLRPSLAHIPVQKYWLPKDFEHFKRIAEGLGFKKVNSGPLVRSSYHAELPQT
ncbi:MULTISPECIES: lipoyl synthase [Prochlorococcus]|uniref:Lipoyl synthase 2 n=1 Tax=Prochlorococcus marinus (strain SARG / CCMP1375 / SS120) TaxID=167539 RepID=LIPA2_PROMA|nr:MULTISPECIES: lipoyl synthase [Prochlorococcus]Q7VBJ3.1 RecName: Full=Lipoyl synthase 2; AltName: Full=Lip-syn 2; Short=LS 2; AltName: Full=Lipoate synthase 2; AltName: Full=Lipoic acid synthase 2; AltName: Full=Sulfur insertion protein LipA 2 [Prochlorococcus marinus subsp. marinus str. CCMP1375]AAQ00144.1 Lipoate synthase [Prochlorococcus marinus subsp. marinus str. CCMP1375]KGG13940.1 Lipoate synthase [Prochlorococcus marinus str. LG]KGG19073.1 Lipoate synthase [Prochlorococcus marinus st